MDNEEISKPYIIVRGTSLPKSYRKAIPNPKTIGGEDKNKINSRVIEESFI
ncbi:TPA: hypothetical protein KOQ79_002767 [Clostridioides difficile]|nr:hypothetical protein [Clostridioides difficile]HBF5456796.1 hypothetical protein [Clostridioides difficile]